jgi:hypothetical protein
LGAVLTVNDFAMRAVLLFLFALGVHVHAIDLSPRWIDTYAEGLTFRRLYFASDDGQKITVRTSADTETSAGFGGTVFRFPKFPETTVILTRSSLSPEAHFSDLQTLDRYREAARHLLPAGAKASEIREEVQNPLPINHWQSYRVLISFPLNGQSHLQSVTFLNLNEREQITLVTTALENQWEEAEARSFRIIRTWQPLLPGDERPPTVN